jgi:hypothetical protein
MCHLLQARMFLLLLQVVEWLRKAMCHLLLQALGCQVLLHLLLLQPQLKRMMMTFLPILERLMLSRQRWMQ